MHHIFPSGMHVKYYDLILLFHCGGTFDSWPFLSFSLASGEDALRCFYDEFDDLTVLLSFLFPVDLQYAF